jgi:hypothetical protein
MTRYFGCNVMENQSHNVYFRVLAKDTSIRQFLDHYHLERNHQGLENRLITLMKEKIHTEARIERRERLCGLLNYYYRASPRSSPVQRATRRLRCQSLASTANE